MKKIIILLLLSLTLFGANVDDFAKEMGFFRDYKTALTQAQKENKPLMMVLGADYCPWCRKFERNTLSTKMIKTYLDKEVITLIVDKKYDADSFPKDFQTQLTPRVFFIDPKSQKSFYDTTGYVKKKEYLKDLEAMTKLYRAK